MNTLVTRIQCEEGYRRDLPIAYLNSEGQGHEVPAATTMLTNMPDAGSVRIINGVIVVKF